MKKRILFPGSSCYPVSPSNKNKDDEDEDSDVLKISENDQLIKILEQLGELHKNDFSFLSKSSTEEYAELVSSQIKTSIKLSKRFSESSKTVVNILESLLEFNHFYRLSAQELLKHHIFDDIRDKHLERGAPFQINLLCDAKDAFDYS